MRRRQPVTLAVWDVWIRIWIRIEAEEMVSQVSEQPFDSQVWMENSVKRTPVRTSTLQGLQQKLKLSGNNTWHRYSSIGLVLLSYCTMVGILLWSAYTRDRDFMNYHSAMAASSVDELARGIEHIVLERQRLVQIFAEQHVSLLRAVRLSPDDTTLQSQLEQAIRRFFPGYFAYTLTTMQGQALLEDYEGYVGDLCLADVREYSETGLKEVRVHPNAFVYHFDIMAHWGEDEGLLLISFPTDEIRDRLRTAQAPGHELMLIQPTESNLIEITASGARDSFPQEDYRMTAEQLGRILISKPVQHSRWALLDSFQPQFVAQARRALWADTGFLIIGLGLVCLVIGSLLWRQQLVRYRAEALKDEFVSIVSHELRTPLTSIQGALGLLQAGVCGPIPEQAREFFSIAANNAERLRFLVDDLLDMRKIESGNLDLMLREVDVIQLVRNAVEDNQGYAARFDVRFEIRPELTGVRILADPLRMAQVLGNLLSNAAKFSDPNSLVEIVVRRHTDEQVEIAVRDEGQGVPLDFRSSLFQKFTQAEQGAARRHAGTGLGLAIVKALVEAHGGSVGYQPQPQRGSVFYIRLPIVKAA